ncbi:MAG: DUF1513 domain-containing protein [Pseudomonadota bacterium]
MTTRRAVLGGLAATAFLPNPGWSNVGAPVALSAARLPDGAWRLVGLDATGAITFEIPLPARGHAAAAHPLEAEAVAIARRPGRFAVVLDCVEGQVRKTLAAPEGRHFYGHAAFTRDGRYLLTTENAFETGEGRVGIWDRAAGFERVADVPSGGIGPHEIIRLPDGAFAIANGGIRTHPASGRDKLNLETMRANLTIMTADGVITDRAEMPDPHRLNSLRHIASLPDGRIGCGYQWQGDPFEVPALLAVFETGKGLEFVDMDEPDMRRLDAYIGSIAAIGAQGFSASSPRGGQVVSFGAYGRVGKRFTAQDVCGIASSDHSQTLVTDGLGQVYAHDHDELRVLARHDMAFDNHLVSLSA